MDDGFDAELYGECKKQLVYWRQIENRIKFAEQVNKAAVIPAINELRYAARQLLYAANLILKDELNEGEKNSVRKRLILSEQYFLNADHDIVDSIVSFISKIIEEAELEVGPHEIASHFNDYFRFRRKVEFYNDKIRDSRSEADARIDTYKTLHKGISELYENFGKFKDAEIIARHNRNRIETELELKRTQNKYLAYFGVFSGFASIVGVPLAIYLWLRSPDVVCTIDDPSLIDQLICAVL